MLLERAYWDSEGRRTANTIARPAVTVAEIAGFRIPAGKTFLIVPEDKIGKEYRFSGEKLGTVLAVFRYSGFRTRYGPADLRGWRERTLVRNLFFR